MAGEKAAMACTVAVEEVIIEHYNEQLRTLNLPEYKTKYAHVRKVCSVVPSLRWS